MAKITDRKPPVSEMPGDKTAHSFSHFSARVAEIMGSGTAFLMAVLVVIVWGVTGPYFHYSDSWQLVINTSTTIITFLMVFLIQNTQNRDARALQLKLNEIIRSIGSAHNEMINIEKLSDDDLEELARFYEQIRRECEQRISSRAAADPTKTTPPS